MRAAIGEAVPIIIKMNVNDGVLGVRIDDAIHLAQRLESQGAVDLLSHARAVGSLLMDSICCVVTCRAACTMSKVR